MTRAPSTEEPCAAKVASTVLKANGGGDPFVEPNVRFVDPKPGLSKVRGMGPESEIGESL